jgi:hypothetical protein
MNRMGETIEADEAEDPLVEQLLDCSDDPLAFVNSAFPDIKPEKWQREVLETIGSQLRENARLNRWKAVQIAVASGNTVGKTALLTWLILWALMTFEDALGVVTAGTEPQIRTRLWGELAKWFYKLPDALRAQFELTATALFNKQNQHTWRCDGRPWSERNQESWSGLHNFGKRVLVVMDECSMIPDPIWRATDGMLSDAETEIIWCVFGNPLRLDGRFPMCFPGGRFSGLWHSIQVDSREVSITNKETINEKLAYYGENSNYARSHILGQFPTASTEQLIPASWVEQASVRETFTHPADAVVIGVDVASGHSEDSSCIVVRRGLDARSYPIQRFATLNPLELAFKVAATANEVGADAVFIDATGLGEGTVAQCRALGLTVHAVYFGGKADNSSAIAGRAANKRAECWLLMRDWLRGAGAIPVDRELMAELCGPEYSEAAAGILIERKADMRSRGLKSPDSADALSLTFSSPVWHVGGLAGPGDHQVSHEYNPFGDDVMAGRPIPELTRKYIAPGWPSLKSDEWSHDDLADAMASDRMRYARGEDDGDAYGTG